MAGLRLLQAMRAAGHGQPVACCHGSFDTLRRIPLLTDTDACFGVCGLKAMEEGVVLALALAGTAHAASPACWRAPSAPYTLCIGAGQGIVLVLDRV